MISDFEHDAGILRLVDNAGAGDGGGVIWVRNASAMLRLVARSVIEFEVGKGSFFLDLHVGQRVKGREMELKSSFQRLRLALVNQARDGKTVFSMKFWGRKQASFFLLTKSFSVNAQITTK